MNFEFLQKLRGLNNMYTPCKDAEELALSKPYLSMAASRKGAEALARFIYINAYKDHVDGLTFAEILKDYNVRNYINNRDVMDAFHHIRKSGNDAVHGNEALTSIQSLELLEDLHFIMGEVAKRANLLSSYPRFNRKITEKPDATLHDYNINEIVDNALKDYLAAEKIKDIQAEYTTLMVQPIILPGEIELHESIRFSEQPKGHGIITHLQEYFGSIVLAVYKEHVFTDEQQSVIQAQIMVSGEANRVSSDNYEFMDILLHDLPNAKSFSIDIHYCGPEFRWDKRENWKLSEDQFYYFSKGKEQERFCYKQLEYLKSHGEVSFSKVVDGKAITVQNFLTNGIIHKKYSEAWECTNLDLYVDFDFDKHPDIVVALHNAVNKHIPIDEYKYCLEMWEDECLDVLINSICWQPESLNTVQAFLDEINTIIHPIMGQCNCSAQGTWFIPRSSFAVATWVWTPKGFKVIGTEF